MKKYFLLVLSLIFVFAGCGKTEPQKEVSQETTKNNGSAIVSSDNTEETISSTTSTVDKEKNNSDKLVTSLNSKVAIQAEGVDKYYLTVTEVLDVTEEAKNKTTNGENNLSFYSSNQANQAVRITILMENTSGEDIGLSYLDDVKIIDDRGVTNVGGWKDHASYTLGFGSYEYDENNEPSKKLYQIDNGEKRIATSTALLANPSNEVKFVFKSEKFNDSIEFILPITK